MICGRKVNRLKLANALVQPTPSAMALKLMACLFTKEELVNGNPSGESKSKDERRQRTINELESTVLRYIEGEQAIIVFIVFPENLVQQSLNNHTDSIMLMFLELDNVTINDSHFYSHACRLVTRCAYYLS